MNINRVMIAAPKSGSGKTMITCAILQAVKNNGKKVVSFKSGPDYIDPMFHEKIIDISSRNLDTFFTDENTTRKLFVQNVIDSEYAVMEGVMGLYDGIGGIREEGSSYHLAKVTATPIILVVDAKGMGRSVISLIAGFLAYDTHKLIKGVILNKMSKGYYEIMKPIIEDELGIKVVGYFPVQKDIAIESRYLGLVIPDEIKDIKEQLQKMSGEIVKTVSIPDVLRIAESAEKIHVISDKGCEIFFQEETSCPTIAVAYDEAFCFYYKDNLQMIQDSGANIVYFSPIYDDEVPPLASGILLGGGYPELYADKLSANKSMLASIKNAYKKGMPIVAECGGFMYLHSKVCIQSGESYEMADVIAATCQYTGKLVRFGYIELEEIESDFIPKDEKIKAHEFHYFDSTYNGESCIATKPVTGKSYNCIVKANNCWMGFPHLYYPSNPAFVKSFVNKCKLWERV